jgi:hypothetical protein
MPTASSARFFIILPKLFIKYLSMQRKVARLEAYLPVLIRIAGYPKVDLHGKTKEEAERAIDRLSHSTEMAEVVTGHGKGILKDLIRRLAPVYGYRILSVAPNNASFILDFT